MVGTSLRGKSPYPICRNQGTRSGSASSSHAHFLIDGNRHKDLPEELLQEIEMIKQSKGNQGSGIDDDRHRRDLCSAISPLLRASRSSSSGERPITAKPCCDKRR